MQVDLLNHRIEPDGTTPSASIKSDQYLICLRLNLDSVP